MSAAFEGWTIKQLQAYIRETGGNPDEADSKRELILMCVSAARAAEAAVAPSVPAPVPPAGGRKRALLIGCNYAGTSAALAGCENDARCLEYLLRTRFAFDDITLLLDSSPYPQAWPTRANILWHANALAAGASPGDSLFFSFSGHGAQVRDPTGDEDDGMNETILPCDHASAGMIVDDELNQALINPLAAGVKLHALIDACHSGSALDLEWQADANPGPIVWQQTYARAPSMWKGSAGGWAVQIAASRDAQVAADTAALSGTHTGAATFSFIQAIELYGTNCTYDALLRSMLHVLHSVSPETPSMLGGGGGGLMALLSGVLGGGIATMSGQTPQLASNLAFELTTPLMI